MKNVVRWLLMIPAALLVYVLVSVLSIWLSSLCAKMTGTGIGFVGLIICSIFASFAYMYVGVLISPSESKFYPSILLTICMPCYLATTQIINFSMTMEALLGWVIVIVSIATCVGFCFSDFAKS